MHRVLNWLCARIPTLALLLVITPFCVPIDRGESRTTLMLDAEYAETRDFRERTGCDEPPRTWEQSHEQFGGRAAVRWEQRHGINVEGNVAVAHGTVRTAETTTTDPLRLSEYTFVAVGGELGVDRRYFGISVRPGFVASTGSLLPLLNAEIRLGDLTAGWLEIGGGTPISPSDSRAFYVGPGFAAGPVRGELGAAFLLYAMKDAYRDELVYGDDSLWGGYASLEWRFHERAGLRLGGIGAKTPSARVGFLVDF